MSDVRVQLVTRVGCHLCAQARDVVTRVVPAGEWEELDVDDPAAEESFRAEHTDWVPVVLLDGRVFDRFRVDEGRLRRALAAPRGRRWRPW